MHTTSRPLSQTTVLLVASALTVLLAASSCGSADPTAEPTPTEVTGTTTPGTFGDPPNPSSAAEVAYAQFWHVWTRANDPPNPELPDLAGIATAGQLELLRTSIRANADKGVRFEEPNPTRRSHKFTIVDASPDQVVIRDCTVDDGVSRDIETGALIDDSLATYLFKATLVLEGGSWKLADNERLGKWPGITNCD